MAILPSQDTDRQAGQGFADNLPSSSTQSAANSNVIPKGLLVAVGLMGVSVFINYIDRGNLAIAAPFLKKELDLSPAQLGILLSSFFWTYAGCQILSGWLVDRYDVSWVLAAGFFLWSAATSATGVVYGFTALLMLRLALGAGESVAFPSYCKILAQHCPEFMRGRANAFISAGIAAGPAFGVFFGARLVDRYGWRPFFVGLGLLSLLWLIPWMRWRPRGAGLTDRAKAVNAPGLLQILEQRSAWGTFGGLFAYNYLSYFLLTWLPLYLVDERKFSMASMGNIGGAAYGMLASSALLCGWISDRWIAAGGNLTRVRKMFTALGLAMASAFCIAVEFFPSDSQLAVLFLLLMCASAGLCTSNLWAITQTLAGPQAAGKWTGLQNFAGNFAGIVSPALTGFVVHKTGHYFWAFAATAAVLLGGAISWAFVVGRVEPVDWATKADGTGRGKAPVTG